MLLTVEEGFDIWGSISRDVSRFMGESRPTAVEATPPGKPEACVCLFSRLVRFCALRDDTIDAPTRHTIAYLSRNTTEEFPAPKIRVLLWLGETHFESESGVPSPHAAGRELAGGH